MTVSDAYQSLVDDCVAIITESVHISREILIRGHHALGGRIVNDKYYQWNARGNGATLQSLSKSTGIQERTLYRAIQFYREYPDLDKFLNEAKEGKNLSWNKIITNYLTDGKPDRQPRPWNVFRMSLLQSLSNYKDEILGGDVPEKVREAWRQFMAALEAE